MERQSNCDALRLLATSAAVTVARSASTTFRWGTVTYRNRDGGTHAMTDAVQIRAASFHYSDRASPATRGNSSTPWGFDRHAAFGRPHRKGHEEVTVGAAHVQPRAVPVHRRSQVLALGPPGTLRHVRRPEPPGPAPAAM